MFLNLIVIKFTKNIIRNKTIRGTATLALIVEDLNGVQTYKKKILRNYLQLSKTSNGFY